MLQQFLQNTIQNHEFFASLDDLQIAQIVRCLRKLDFVTGKEIIREGVEEYTAC